MLRFDTSKRPVRNYFSRREQWRLLLLVLSLGVVILVMREVRDPNNAAQVAQAFAADETPPHREGRVSPDQPHSPVPTDAFRTPAADRATPSVQTNSNAVAAGPKLDELLSLAGWTPERFGKFTDNEPLTNAERDELVQLLWRVRTFDASAFEQVDANREFIRGAMVRLSGRATNFARQELAAEDAARFEMPAYYTCDLKLEGDGGRAVVVTPAVPSRWEQIPKLDEPARASGLYVKQLPSNGEEPDSKKPVYLLVAKRIAWHPEKPREPAVSFGMSVLGSLAMDVGLLDQVRSHGRFETGDASQRARLNDEREAFYQMLDAVGAIGANQLIRFANGNLEMIRRQWTEEMSTTKDGNRRALAQEVVQRAEQGRYSIAPLFNDAPRQIGRLVVVDGAARRAVRVDVGSSADGGASEVARRFGIDHYYQLEVFTDDSQNYPLVFCVRDLPAGVPVGEGLHVPVRVAGFFFKDWLYTTRGSRDVVTGELDPDGGKSQYAPLLIGRAPLVLQLEQGQSELPRLVAGGLFLLALAGIWAVAWWLSRGDRRFAERRREAAHSLPPGQSLDSLKLAPVDEPMNVPGKSISATGEAG